MQKQARYTSLWHRRYIVIADGFPIRLRYYVNREDYGTDPGKARGDVVANVAIVECRWSSTAGLRMCNFAFAGFPKPEDQPPPVVESGEQ